MKKNRMVLLLLSVCAGNLFAEVLKSVNITTEPEFADIYIDGIYKGISPLQLQEIENGEHVLKAVHPVSGVIEKKVVFSEGLMKFPIGEDKGISYKENISAVSGSFRNVEFKKAPSRLNKFYYMGMVLLATSAGLYFGKKQYDKQQGSTMRVRMEY